MGGVTPDRSREVPIPERSGTAFRKGPGLARPIRSVPFRLQNLGCPGLRARGSLGPTPRALSGLLAPGAGASQHAGRAATPATVLRRLFMWFCFSRRSPETRCFCWQGGPPALFPCVGGLRGFPGGRTSQDPGPHHLTRARDGTGGAETGPAKIRAERAGQNLTACPVPHRLQIGLVFAVDDCLTLPKPLWQLIRSHHQQDWRDRPLQDPGRAPLGLHPFANKRCW